MAQPKTFALAVYLDPSAPFLMDSIATQSQTRLANQQWLVVDGDDADPESPWRSPGEDPAMRGGVDYLAFYVIDMSNKLPDAPQFLPRWKSRTAAGRWTVDPAPAPYEGSLVVPPAKNVPNPPGLEGQGKFKVWFFGPVLLSEQVYSVTYALAGTAIGTGSDESYWLDPEMEIGPP